MPVTHRHILHRARYTQTYPVSCPLLTDIFLHRARYTQTYPASCAFQTGIFLHHAWPLQTDIFLLHIRLLTYSCCLTKDVLNYVFVGYSNNILVCKIFYFVVFPIFKNYLLQQHFQYYNVSALTKQNVR